jgi:hypothetical protein
VDPLEANIDTDFGIDTKKGRLHAGLFVWGKGRLYAGRFVWGASRRVRVRYFLAGAKKNFALHATFRHYPILWFRRLVGQRTCVLLR